MKPKNFTDRIGVFSSVLCFITCIGTPIIMSLLTAIGVIVFIGDRVLKIIMLFFLFASELSIFISYQKHKNIYVFAMAIFSGIIVIVFSVVIHLKILIYIGLLCLVIASFLSSSKTNKCRSK